MNSNNQQLPKQKAYEALLAVILLLSNIQIKQFILAHLREVLEEQRNMLFRTLEQLEDNKEVSIPNLARQLKQLQNDITVVSAPIEEWNRYVILLEQVYNELKPVKQIGVHPNAAAIIRRLLHGRFPSTLTQVMDRRYGLGWPTKVILVPKGDGFEERTILDDLYNQESYIRRILSETVSRLIQYHEGKLPPNTKAAKSLVNLYTQIHKANRWKQLLETMPRWGIHIP